MSNPFRVSEIVEVELKPDVDLSSPEMAKHQNDALDTISSQPGCTSIHYGPSIEHKDKMVMVIGASAPARTPSLAPPASAPHPS